MMNRALKGHQGVTLVELMMVVAVGSAVIIPIVYFMMQSMTFYRATNLHTQLESDAVSSRFVLRKFMQLGSAKTLTIDTPANSPPNSHARFSIDNSTGTTTTYDISWVNRTVQMTKAGTLANNVDMISFVVPNPAIPTQVAFTIRLSVAVDSKHQVTAELVNQLVEMLP